MIKLSFLHLILLVGTGVCLASTYFAHAGFAVANDASCASDFRLDSPGGPLEGVGVEKQSGSNCYAYAATTLMDAWGRSHDLVHGGYSSVDTSASAQFASVLEKYRPVTNCAEALDYMRHFGVCDQTAFLETLPNGTRESLKDYRGRLGFATALIESYRQDYLSPGSTPQSRTGLAHQLGAWLEQHFFPPGTRLSDDLMDRALSHPTRDGVEQAIFAEACASHLEHPVFPRTTHVFPHAVFVSTVINEVFNSFAQDPRPVALQVCAKMFLDRKNYTGLSGTKRATSQELLDCGPHAITLIGRRYNKATRSCEFLTKNSWAKDCAAYRAQGYDCEDATGLYWTPEAELNKGILALTFLGEIELPQ